MRAPSQRRALGALFLVLALGFGAIAVTALLAGQWVIGAAAAGLAGWLGTLAASSLRPRRRD